MPPSHRSTNSSCVYLINPLCILFKKFFVLLICNIPKKAANTLKQQNNSPMKKLMILLLMTFSLTHAQELDINKLKGMKPRSIGPAGMSGRITAIDVVNNNPKVIYAGAASG